MSLAETLGPTKAAHKLEIPVKTLANGLRISTDPVPREGGLSLAVIIALKTRRVLGYSLPGS